MINEVTEKLNFLKGKLSLDIFIIKVLDKSGKELFLTFQSGGAVEQESWFDASWFMTPEEAKAKSTEMSDKDLVVEHVDINKYVPPSGETTMYLQCSDGTLHVARQAYNESDLVRDLIDNGTQWISNHSMRDVADELEELYMK